jgi:crossover junction endodeoxyribonuclease RuvC
LPEEALSRRAFPEQNDRMASGREQNGRLCVAGIDPAASGPTGYAVLEFDGRETRTLRFGALRHPSRAPFGDRLCELHRLLSELLAEFSPHALKLAEARGVVLLAAAQAGVTVHSYTPREVKFQVAGYGAASKAQMQTMVASLLELSEPPRSPDAADALALALCHISTERARRRVGTAGDHLYPARIEA